MTRRKAVAGSASHACPQSEPGAPRIPTCQPPLRSSRAAEPPLTGVRSGGGGLPAPWPARCARMQEPEPGEAPGRGRGDPRGTAQRRRWDRTVEAPARSRDALCCRRDPGRPCAHVGVGAPGGRGRGRDPLRDAPRLPRAQPRLDSRTGEGGPRVWEGRGLGRWAGVSGISSIQPPPPARSRASAPKQAPNHPLAHRLRAQPPPHPLADRLRSPPRSQYPGQSAGTRPWHRGTRASSLGGGLGKARL
ncbi:hypothetical protein P7K49_033443 [Saguinus oedipus]|uniref:Uncharacterized protein n=1 Tax=Saguinus oedipus TaxID=9490 RepID=A0ABQ9TRY7_SAGOE|nr:hypothetical protein P7K49_033443 [Saguinus oedipus]